MLGFLFNLFALIFVIGAGCLSLISFVGLLLDRKIEINIILFRRIWWSIFFITMFIGCLTMITGLIWVIFLIFF